MNRFLKGAAIGASKAVFGMLAWSGIVMLLIAGAKGF